jgi:hypothetical protein
MKATHKLILESGRHNTDIHSITIEGRTEEFHYFIDALSNSTDQRVQQMATYIMKSLSMK